MGVAKYRGGRWSARRGKGEGRRECRQNRIGQAALGVQTTVSVRLRCVALRCVAELRPGRIVTKNDLERMVLGAEAEVASNALEVHVSSLRRKLGRDVIDTVRGLGYRLGST